MGENSNNGCGCSIDTLLCVASAVGGGFNGYFKAKGIDVPEPFTYNMLWYLPAAVGGGLGGLRGAFAGGLLGSTAGFGLGRRVSTTLGGGFAGSVAGAGIVGAISAGVYSAYNAAGFGIGYLIGKFTD